MSQVEVMCRVVGSTSSFGLVPSFGDGMSLLFYILFLKDKTGLSQGVQGIVVEDLHSWSEGMVSPRIWLRSVLENVTSRIIKRICERRSVFLIVNI